MYCFYLSDTGKKRYRGKHSGYALSYKGSPRNARNSHLHRNYHYQIENNISHRGSDKKDKRGPGISPRGENSRADVVHKEKRQPRYVYPQIQS